MDIIPQTPPPFNLKLEGLDLPKTILPDESYPATFYI